MNLLEKYYLQGKGKLMAGIFVLVVLLIISTIAFTGCFSSGKKSDDKNTVTVFNYGDYIDVSVLKTFEKETGIKVKYEEYVTPEDMYTKYKSGVINYDVICTSDFFFYDFCVIEDSYGSPKVRDCVFIGRVKCLTEI